MGETPQKREGAEGALNVTKVRLAYSACHLILFA